ncbi:hypothetical protein PLESTB_000318200 [Pleodorina starrii]|uniref:Uncharacterized protein n=1 Tax=Pleodorina starrii TaxID=330485 RepID=A0A9W6EZ36_9CHLO|nr:hypothetical protein PLESTM_001739900 [Pleodorina starrii]GLC49875.1 hypothetical protein PLESTB_000318200 [Pleodorina starrii]GLC68255.1 hypothetical protein PLESTF_000667200 [Pleodorina starrii]
MDKRDAVEGHAQDGWLKSGRQAGSASTAPRPMRQLTLTACLSPNATRITSPSVAAPAATRSAAPEPSATSGQVASATPATSNPPTAPSKRKLNLASPPKSAHKLTAHADAKAPAKTPNGATGHKGAAAARPARGFSFGNPMPNIFGAVAPQGTGHTHPDARAGSLQAPTTTAAAAAVAVPAELDRIGGDGSRMERSLLPPAHAGTLGRGPDDEGPDDEGPDEEPQDEEPQDEEQQGESVGPTQEPQWEREERRQCAGRAAAPGPTGAGPMVTDDLTEAARRLAQEPGRRRDGSDAAAAAAAAAALGRPRRAAAERAKQRMKMGAGAVFGESQPSDTASGSTAAPVSSRRASESSGGAQGHNRNRKAGASAFADDGDDDDDDDGGGGRAAEAHSPLLPAANAHAGRVASTIIIDLDLEESNADDNAAAHGDEDVEGGHVAAAAVAGPHRGSGGAAAAPAASSGDLDDDDYWEQAQQPAEPPSLPEWDPRRPGYADLAAVLAYRRACQRGEMDPAEDLPRCWGAGLLGEALVLCNVLLRGYAAILIQAARQAALQGRLGRLHDQKLVRVDQHDMLSYKQLKVVGQQFERRLRRAVAERLTAADGGPGRDWRTLTHAEILEHLPEFIPPSRKVERTFIGEDGDPSPWDDVPAMRGQASLRVKPGCALKAAEYVGVYSGEGWLHADWQAQGLVKPQDEWDDDDHPCPFRFTAARKHELGRYAADCALPDCLLRHLDKLDLREPRLRTLLGQEPGEAGKVFMTAARLGCLMAAANDPSRNLTARCKAEADFRAGGPNVAVVNVVVLGILPVMVMVATTDIRAPQHLMYYYDHSYWELHEEEEAVCKQLEEVEAQAEARVRAAQAEAEAEAARAREAEARAEAAWVEAEKARKWEAGRRKKRKELKAAIRKERETSRQQAQAAEAARKEAEEARRREEEERQARLAAEEKLRQLLASLQQQPTEVTAQPPPLRRERELQGDPLAEERAGPSSSLARQGHAPPRLNWLPPRGAAVRRAVSGTSASGGCAAPAAAPAPPEEAAGGDAAGAGPGLGPGAAAPGVPLGKRNRAAEDAVAEAEMGSPTARHRTAAASTQTQAEPPPATAVPPPLPASLFVPLPLPLPTTPQPPLPPSASADAMPEGVRIRDDGCDDGCHTSLMDWGGPAAAAARPRPTSAHEAEPGGEGSGRKTSRLRTRKSREAALAAAGAAAEHSGLGAPPAPLASTAPWQDPRGNAAPLPPGFAIAGAGAGQVAGRRGGAAGDGGAAAAADLVVAAAALELPESPAVQPQQRSARSPRRRDTDPDRPDSDQNQDPHPDRDQQPQPQPRSRGAARRLEQPVAAATHPTPPGPLPSQQQQQQPQPQPQQQQDNAPEMGPRGQRRGQGQEREEGLTGRFRPPISGLRGQNMRYNAAPRPFVVDLVSDSD